MDSPANFAIQQNILESVGINPDKVKILEIGGHQILRWAFSVRPQDQDLDLPIDQRRPESSAYSIVIPGLGGKIAFTIFDTTGKFVEKDPQINSGEYNKFLTYLNRQKMSSISVTNIHDANLGGKIDPEIETGVKKNPGLLADFLPEVQLSPILALAAMGFTEILKYTGRRATTPQQKIWFAEASKEWERKMEKVNVTKTFEQSVRGASILMKAISQNTLDYKTIEKYTDLVIGVSKGNKEA